jgi:superfamily II DNA or RNA helicase
VDKNAEAQATELTVNLGLDDFDQLGRQIDIQIAPLQNSGKARRPIELWDHQVDYLKAIDSDPNRCVLAVMPTGGGKTSVAASIIKRYSSDLKSAIFVVHRREIVKQASDRLKEEGVAHGIIMAGKKDRGLDRIQVCSIQET